MGSALRLVPLLMAITSVAFQPLTVTLPIAFAGLNATKPMVLLPIATVSIVAHLLMIEPDICLITSVGHYNHTLSKLKF